MTPRERLQEAERQLLAIPGLAMGGRERETAYQRVLADLILVVRSTLAAPTMTHEIIMHDANGEHVLAHATEHDVLMIVGALAREYAEEDCVFFSRLRGSEASE